MGSLEAVGGCLGRKHAGGRQGSYFSELLVEKPGDDPSPPAPGDASAEGNKTPFSHVELAGEASFSSYPTAL